MQRASCRLFSSLSQLGKPLRPRRALFNIPGSDEKKLRKASVIVADSVVYDLEDGVPMNQKGAARSLVLSALEKHQLHSACEKAVRINAVGSGLEIDDLQVVLSSNHLEALVIPKVESREQLAFVSHMVNSLAPAATRNSVRLIACIESALGLLNIREIASACPGRLEALVFASEDYCADTSIIRTEHLRELLYARSTVVTAAVAHQLQAIDLVCIDYKSMEKLEKECVEGRQLGFTGKQAIHPGQLATIQSHFSPTLQQLEKARLIISEYERHIQRGVGAFVIDNKMVDMPVVKWAQGIVRSAEHYSG